MDMTLPPGMTEPSAGNPPQRILNPDGLKRLGGTLQSRFLRYEMDRRLAELKWARNARQVLGVYDPDVELKLDPNRSRAYPKITRVKCVSMLARLMNLLFPTDDKCWTIAPSAVPNLENDDLQTVLDQLLATKQPPPSQQPPGAQGMPPPPVELTNEEIEQSIRAFAKKRAARLELEIEDQLQELGGSRMVDFVALCRKVLTSGIQYGMGVLEGPFVEVQQLRRWDRDASGRYVPVPYEAYRPRFEFVPIWDYYPDMSAKYLHQMDGQFIRRVMAKHQVIMLKQREDFIPDQVDAFLRVAPNGNYKRRAFETELKSMGVQINVTEAERNKYEAIVWHGYATGQELRDAGAVIPDDKLNEDMKAEIWLLNEFVVKATLDPWTELDTDGEMKMFHHFVFEEDESTLLGNALPNIVRDSQMGVAAATRMAIDNASVLRNFEVNTSLLSLNQDMSSIQTDKIWYRDDESVATANIPAVKVIELPMHLQELQGLVKLFMEFSDAETFVNQATGGDLQKGPSEPFRTATGASMLRGDAALPFKDVVRNFDVFTESVIGSMIAFNKTFNQNPDIRGDFKPVARGATSLIAKEVLGIQLDNLAQTLTDGEKKYVNTRELARARVRVRDLVVEDIVYDDARCDQIDAQESQTQSEQQDTIKRMTEAQIRQILADTLKSISLAGKNSAAAEAQTANVILAALEKGISPDELTKQPAGAGGAAAGNGQAQPSGGGTPNLDAAAAAAGSQGQGQPAEMQSGGVSAAAGPSGGAGFALP
jgi:hypothetical protein